VEQTLALARRGSSRYGAAAPVSESTLLMKLGVAAHYAVRTSALVKITLPEAPPKGERERRADSTFAFDRVALKKSLAARVDICRART
jgi:hypothetical protein